VKPEEKKRAGGQDALSKSTARNQQVIIGCGGVSVRFGERS
jgi:hypothetical protein